MPLRRINQNSSSRSTFLVALATTMLLSSLKPGVSSTARSPIGRLRPGISSRWRSRSHDEKGGYRTKITEGSTERPVVGIDNSRFWSHISHAQYGQNLENRR